MQTIGTASNIITGLPEMTWRGLISPPYDTANASGSFMLAPSEFPYVDGVSHDNMGSSEIPMEFRLHFINTVQPLAFPQLFDAWREAVINDVTPGKLRHPLLGMLDARVAEWNIELVAQRTAGVIMTVKFVDTLLDPDEVRPFDDVEVDVKELARQIDLDINNLEINFPDGARTTNLLELINQIESAAFQFRTRVEGLVNQALGIAESLIETVENLQSHVTWALTFNLKAFHRAVKLLSKRVVRAPLRRTALFITPRVMTLDEVASEVGNTLGEIIGLNGPLLIAPAIPPDTAVSYFTE